MSTMLIRLSRAANRQVTGETIMLCATAYERNWLVFVRVVNVSFLWKHTYHCQRCWRYERRLAMTEDWELDFSNPPRINPPGATTCGHCGDIIHRDTCFKKKYWNGKVADTEHFCDDSCHQHWYINRLNTLGM